MRQKLFMYQAVNKLNCCKAQIFVVVFKQTAFWTFISVSLSTLKVAALCLLHLHLGSGFFE